MARAVLFERHPLERTVRRRMVANELSIGRSQMLPMLGRKSFGRPDVMEHPLAFACWLFGSLFKTLAVLCTLCRHRHKIHWTKPLRGSCRVAMVGATPSSCIFEEVRLRHHGGLLAAALPYRKGASHDCSSTTNDGGYAGSEFVASHAGIISPTGLAIRTPLRQVAR